MAIQNISEAVGFSPVEQVQSAIPVAPASVGSSPASSTGEGAFAPKVSSPVPGEILPIQSSNLQPQNIEPATAQLGDSLTAALAGVSGDEAKNPSLTPQEGPQASKLDGRASGVAAPQIDAPEGSIEMPAAPLAPGETPKAAPTYQSVLSPVAMAPRGVQIPPVKQLSVETPRGTYTSVLPTMARSNTPTDTSPSWLKYSNQGATRNLPISGQLTKSLNFLGEMGIEMEVFSGGQPAKGTSSKRVGSVRHDHGDSADVFFYQNGRRLDWAKASDRPVFEQIVQRAKAAGVTGFGAGDGYMQPGSMHIGFGTPGVWGAGGKGTNAPSWLRNAFGG